MRPTTTVLYALHVPVDTRRMHEATPAADLEAALDAARDELCAGEAGARITGWELPAWSRDPRDPSQDHAPFLDEPERRKISASDVWPRPGCDIVYVRFVVETTSWEQARSKELTQSVVDEALARADLGHLHGQSAFWRDPDRESTLATPSAAASIYTYELGPSNPPPSPHQGPGL